MTSSSPANSVVGSYITTENMLVDVLRVIPYCEEHENVWSPVLVTILLETCSQLDSLWNYEARQSAYVRKGLLTIKDYFCYFGEQLASRWVIFYGEEPRRIQPFHAWSVAASYKTADFQELQWWTAYNKLKHERLNLRTKATLKHSMYAAAGLFVAILSVESCRNAVAQAGWLLGDSHNPAAWLAEDSPATRLQYITAESKLFTYPVGWSKETVTRRTKWNGVCSVRFRNWFDNQSG